MAKSISTKYLGATNNEPSRIRASDSDGNSVTVSYNHDLDVEGNHVAAAKAFTKKMNWGGKWAGGGTKEGYVFVDITSGPMLGRKG